MPALDSTTDNLSNSTPAAPANSLNVQWQADPVSNDPRNISANVPFATATTPGLVPTPPNDATKYLDGTGAFSKPSGSGLVCVVGITIDGGGSAPSTGTKGFIQVPFAATITGWTIIADQSGSCSIGVKKSTFAAFPTTSSIVASAPPTLSSQQNATSTTLTGWTTTINAGDVLEFDLSSVSTCQRITLELQISRT